MLFRLLAPAALVALSTSASIAGPTVTPNASGGAITVVTPVPLNDAEATASTQAPVRQPTQAQPAPAPAQSSFIANYVASFGR